MIELGALIRKAREDAGLSQEALATRIKSLPGKKLDLSKDQISRIESAARKDMLFPDELQAFTVALGLSQSLLLEVLGFEINREPKLQSSDPREQLIERIRKLPRKPGIERGLDVAISVLEQDA